MRNSSELKKYILTHLPCKCNIKGAKSVKDYKVKSLKTAIVTDIDNNTAVCTLTQSANLEPNKPATPVIKILFIFYIIHIFKYIIYM